MIKVTNYSPTFKQQNVSNIRHYFYFVIRLPTLIKLTFIDYMDIKTT